MELGTVVSTFEGPSTSKFAFVLSGKGVRKGQFVQTETEEGLLVAFVSDITRANRYFERAESVAEYEKTAPIEASFPVTEWEYLVAEARPVGIFSDGVMLRSSFPAAPGAKVVAADEKLLKKFLGFDDDGLHLGRLDNHEVDAKFNLTRLLQKHLAILGISGSGKSYGVSVLIEELLARKKEKGRLAVVVVDVHGEYEGFSSGEFSRQCTVVNGSKIRIALHKVTPSMLAEFVPDLSIPQKRELQCVLANLRKRARDEHKGFDLSDLSQRIADSDIKDVVKSGLLASVSELKRLRLFGRGDFPSLKSLAQPGKLAIIDLNSIDNPKKKQLIVSYFAKRLFLARKKGKVPPFLLLIEEAHNFAPEKTARSEALARGMITTIAREGRKFGASLCLVSQRPKHLSTTALSQCNSNIILRVTNPYDIKHIGESCESIDDAMLKSLSTLRTGEAIVLGEAVSHPVFVKIRRRKSRKSGREEDLEILAKSFEEAALRREKDVEAFL